FIDAALDKGAGVIVAQADRQAKWQPLAQSGRAAFLVVPDSRRALARIAATYRGFPARHLVTIGVTGTDGKTTTVHLIASVLEAAGLPAGYLSSVEFKTDGDAQLNATHMTTTQSPEVQESLAEMVRAGRRCAVIEASSHGLALNRLGECEFDVAVFTTLSSDHLDFHGDATEYLSAKGRLFEMLDESVDKGVGKTGVLNADDPASATLRSRTAAKAVTYGIDAPAGLRAENLRLDALQSDFDIVGPFGRRPVRLPLPGRYSVHDALAAVAVGVSLGIAPEAIVDGLARFKGVPGRMEMIDCGQSFKVVVDIASTPEALRRVLQVLRPLATGRLIVLFGCAGERDRGRRDGMGRVAGELAGFVVLTNEDPRSEDPDAIIADIAAALVETGRREGSDFVRVPDRREAIRRSFEMAHPGDVVLLAGKGTEQSIVVGDEHTPWDERIVGRELLRELCE
ncbi:MAG TPA: UDP-N-acetylmuramoyl-L-alanyl-D-glutamate--2,6-diaminopimelate ligase, partial [Thermoleophilia bacterium]|nr:UDP-N-acetylmuramoyl-L-alanyl-D-glutamate--2,6-diaminopimelate ligase [Thermoleophilia bacterium]